MNETYFTEADIGYEEVELDSETVKHEENATKNTGNQEPNTLLDHDPYVRAVAQFMRQHSNIRVDEDDPLVLGFGFLANHMHTVNNDAFVKFDQATLQTEKFLNVIEEKKHLLLAEIMQKHKQALDFDIHYLNEINNAYWSTPMKQLQYWVKIAVACSIGAGLFALWTFIHIR